LKCLFSTTPKVGKETEANEGHRGDRTLHRTRSWYDRTRPVSTTQQSGARVLGFTTGAFGHSWDRRVWSCAQRELQNARMIGRATRPVTRDRTRPIVEGAYWTQIGRWPVASGRCVERVRSCRCARGIVRSVRPVVARGAFGRCFAGLRCCAIGAFGRWAARPVMAFDRWCSDRWRIGRG
jgi:hypothetical protein